MKERKIKYTICSSSINQYNLHEVFCVRGRKQTLGECQDEQNASGGGEQLEAAAAEGGAARRGEARRGEARVLGEAEAEAGQDRTGDALMAEP